MTVFVSFEQRFADALRRRLYPGTALRMKQMAHELGYSEDTIARWLRGDHRVFAGAAEDVDRYFTERHADPNFLREVMSLQRLDPPRRDADLCLWVTEGAVHRAPAGHALFARDALGLSAGIEQDLVRYAVSNLGWLAGTARADGRFDFRYAPKTLDPQTARRLRDWLLSEGRDLSEVRATPMTAGGWGEARVFSVSEAVRFLDRWAVRVRMTDLLGETNWTVVREDPTAAQFPEFRAILAAAHEPLAACLQAGRIGSSSLLWLKSESDLVSLYIGQDLGLPVDRFACRNVLDRDDPHYAALVYHHALESAEVGPTLYRLEIDIAGRRRRYRRLAMPFQSGDRRMILTTSQLLEPQEELSVP
jgi:hypothetical protein